MNFQYLHKAVQDEIRRPDRNDAITRALRATILQLHTSGFYSRDIVEDFIDISTPENYMKIVQPPRFREVDAIAPVTQAGSRIGITTRNNEYEKVSPHDLFTEAGNELLDIYYISGSTFVIRSSIKPERLYVRYWQLPEVSDWYLETFIMEQYPELIINGTTARVYKQMRQDAASDYQELFNQDFPAFVEQMLSSN